MGCSIARFDCQKVILRKNWVATFRISPRYGQLSLELSLQPLADNVRAAPSPALHLAHPKDWCGVLRFAADFGELQVRGCRAKFLRNCGYNAVPCSEKLVGLE